MSDSSKFVSDSPNPPKSRITPKRILEAAASTQLIPSVNPDDPVVIVRPKTLSKKLRESMTLEQLYETGLTTPSVKKVIIEKENFNAPAHEYCSRFCSLPEGRRDCTSTALQVRSRRRVDVLIVLPMKRPDEPTKYGKVKYGWADDTLHMKIIDYLVEKYLPEFSVEIQFLLKCRPGHKDKVTTTAMKNCSPYLMEQIKHMKPKVIIFLGKETAQGLGVKKPKRGFIDTLEVDGIQIPTIITLHPRITTMIRQNASGSFWGTDYLTIIDHDFKKVSQILRGEASITTLALAIEDFVRQRLFITESIQAIAELRDEILSLPDKTILAWDCETTSLDPWDVDARTLTYQFTYKRPSDGLVISVVVPLWHRCNTLYDPAEAFGYMVEILEAPNTVKIGHNIGFDIIWARVVHNLYPNNIGFDTMLLLHSLNSGTQGFYDLKTATCDYLFKLQLAGYDDGIDLKALQREAVKQIKARLKSESLQAVSQESSETLQEVIGEEIEAEGYEIMVGDVTVF